MLKILLGWVKKWLDQYTISISGQSLEQQHCGSALNTCSCHTQQLAISDAFKSFKDDNESMLDKCQKLTAHLKRADNSRKLLHAECALAGHKPNAIPVANDTRWDSGYDCMKGVLYHQPCLLKLPKHSILLGTILQVNRKSFIFPFSEYLNDWTKSRKLLLLDYPIE